MAEKGRRETKLLYLKKQKNCMMSRHSGFYISCITRAQRSDTTTKKENYHDSFRYKRECYCKSADCVMATEYFENKHVPKPLGVGNIDIYIYVCIYIY
jgi:hypothetical protein